MGSEPPSGFRSSLSDMLVVGVLPTTALFDRLFCVRAGLL